MNTRLRERVLSFKDDLMLWGWRSPGRSVLLTLGVVCVTTLLIFLGQMVGSWLGEWFGGLGPALGMLVGGVGGFVIGAMIAESVGISFLHRCNL
jgi:hypothetical protein